MDTAGIDATVEAPVRPDAEESVGMYCRHHNTSDNVDALCLVVYAEENCPVVGAEDLVVNYRDEASNFQLPSCKFLSPCLLEVL